MHVCLKGDEGAYLTGEEQDGVLLCSDEGIDNLLCDVYSKMSSRSSFHY